jgi:hypothetical protein
MLSRTSSAPVQLPGDAEALHITREELDRVAGPLVARAVDETRRVLQRAGTGRGDLAAILLVGGSSRIPLVASRLHERFGVAPTVPEQPELPVAHGALLAGRNAGRDAGGNAGRDADRSADRAAGRVPRPVDAGPADPTPAPPVAAAPGPSPGGVRRRRRRIAVAAVTIAVLGLAGAGIAYRVCPSPKRSPSQSGPTPQNGPTPQGPASRGAAASSATGVPAGFVRCVGGTVLCPRANQCWAGLTINGAAPPTARKLPCTDPHRWESFAVGYLPAGGDRMSDDDLAALPEVQAVCTAAVMSGRSSDAARTAGWQLHALPQQGGAAGPLFHCVAAPAEGGEWTGSVFRTG